MTEEVLRNDDATSDCLPQVLDNTWYKLPDSLQHTLSSFSLPRSIHLAYVKDVEVKGIQAYRFAPPSDVLMSPKDNPTNEGFCVPAGDCLGTGVLKVSVCREGKRPGLGFPLRT